MISISQLKFSLESIIQSNFMKILVVEDEHKIANSVKHGLEQEAYVVDVAYYGIEGYAYNTE